jgi:Putative F0F1-ATPase subunit Ca2+/Mg2+ transporter
VDPDRTDRSSLRGNANALNRAFEFALTTAIFAGAGYGLDRWLGTSPLLVIVLSLLGVVGQFVRSWFVYEAEMRQHEAALGLDGPRHLTRPDLSRPVSPARQLPTIAATLKMTRSGLSRRHRGAAAPVDATATPATSATSATSESAPGSGR